MLSKAHIIEDLKYIIDTDTDLNKIFELKSLISHLIIKNIYLFNLIDFTSLYNLKIMNSNSTEILNLPPNLQQLELYYCNVINLNNLPEHLYSLLIEKCVNLKDVNNLPKNLQILKISNCNKITQIQNLPDNLQILNIYKCENIKKINLTVS